MIRRALDFDAAPVISAQKLKDDFREKRDFEYWEVSRMGHNMWSLDAEIALMLEKHVLLWPLNKEFEKLLMII